MRKAFHGRAPQLCPGARAAENATLVGDVTLEEESSVWYGARAPGRYRAPSASAGAPISRTTVSSMWMRDFLSLWAAM